jgi:hypothetical protein
MPTAGRPGIVGPYGDAVTEALVLRDIDLGVGFSWRAGRKRAATQCDAKLLNR